MVISQKSIIAALVIGLVTVIGILCAMLNYRVPVAQGSVSRFAEYQSTTTVASASFPQEQTVVTGNATLGSVVITGAAAGVINIYDATTSNVNNRAASMSTSSILKATIPASAAAGTYTFDTLFTNGIYVSIVGTMPTTTITYRQN